jgi:NDP-sugar pyrophosphorylase family protein
MTRQDVRIPFVVLAGGAGSRFGGDKPMTPVGAGGESLLDYTIHDALRVGFSPIVVVVAAGRRTAMSEHLGRHHGLAEIHLVDQAADTFVPRRDKPWGTVHAVVSARDLLTGPFAVANGDDLYGSGALTMLHDAMTDPDDEAHDAPLAHLVAYRWRQTMPHHGSANRGVCRIDERARLIEIDEVRDLTTESPLDPDSLVSMNLWGFGESALGLFSTRLEQFVQADAAHPSAELALPDAVGELVAAGATVRVLVTDERWIGITYADDVGWARERLADMIQAGQYPPQLREPA